MLRLNTASLLHPLNGLPLLVAMAVITGCSSASPMEQPSNKEDSPSTFTFSNAYKPRPKGYKPALLSNPTPEVLGSLKTTMIAMSQKGVQLPSTAFSKSSTVILGQNTLPTANEPYGLPMEHLMPHRFELLISNGHCYVYYANNASLKSAPTANCHIEQP